MIRGGLSSTHDASTGSISGSTVINSQGYTSPFASTPTLGRTDQGVDLSLSPGDPIRAIGKAQIVGIIPNWYAGQPYLWYRLLDGPDAGRFVYVAEQFVPHVRPGDIVMAGDTIGTYAPTGTAIETGWASASGSTLAKSTSGYSEGQVTPAGTDFRAFLTSLFSG